MPFVVLLPKGTKRTGGLLATVAVVVLLGTWLDLYLMVQPATGGSNPGFGPWEVAAIAGTGTLFTLIFARAMRSAPPVPLGDPFLSESLHYRN